MSTPPRARPDVPVPTPGYTTPEAPPDVEPCVVCGREVNAAEPGGFWMLDGAPHHTACVDWTKRPFPYAWAIDAAERATRRLVREQAPRDDELARALAWLRRAAARWPSADPPRTLASAARAAAVISSRSAPAQDAYRDPPPASLAAPPASPRSGRRR